MAKQPYYKGLDGMRGLGVLIVLAAHLGISRYDWAKPSMLRQLPFAGWIEVQMFFVLSGFLITGILFDSLGGPHFYRNFYIRRSLRLLPVYIVLVCVILLFAHGSGGHSWFTTLSYLFYASNIYRFFNPNFLHIGPSQTGHLWSLALEEQFYLVWPVVVFFLRTRKRVLTGCLGGFVGVLALRLVLNQVDPGIARQFYFQLPTQADAFLIGGALAMFFRDENFRELIPLQAVKVACAASVAAFAVMCFSVHSFFFFDPTIATWGFTLIAIHFVALIYLTLTPGTLVHRIYSLPVFQFFGRHSYCIYLFHYPPLDYLNETCWPWLVARLHSVVLTTIVFGIAWLAATTLLAALTHYAIERPFVRLKILFKMPARAPLPEREAKPLELPAIPAS